MAQRGVRLLVAVCVLASISTVAQAQQTPNSANTVVPRLIKFSGNLLDERGSAMKGPVGVTFGLYAEQSGGAALWMETQNVEPSSNGNYSVLLGAASAKGIPQELFASGEARWLGIQVENQAEQPRVLLVSVPYALKAVDAETLGGLPPSAFAQARSSLAESSSAASPSSSLLPLVTANTPSSNNSTDPNVTTPGGTVNFLPKFDTPSDVKTSQIFDNGTDVGIGFPVTPTPAPGAKLDVNGSANIRGTLQLPATSTATATTGFNSRPFDLFASSFNKTSATAVNQHFRWQAEAVGNNTATPSGKLSLLFAPGASAPAETGFSINGNGTVNFAAGQTFPGSTVTGNETVSGNVSAKQFVSTVATGMTPFTVSSKTQVLNLNASLLGGLSVSAFPTLGAATNSFSGSQVIAGSVGIGTTSPAERLDVGNQGNVVIRTDPGSDSAEGNVAYELIGRDAGGGAHKWAIYTAPVGGGFGVPANSLSVWEYPSSGNPGCCLPRFTIMPATVGNTVTIDNTSSLHAFDVEASGNVDAAFFVTAGFDILAGGCVQVNGGTPIGGTCKSDVRLKKNIQPLSTSATLDKAVHLQPVSYNWRADEYPQYRLGSSKAFGLIAQDVEKIFPEMVSVDKDGFKNVNYSELPYLMLQAIRELKAENDDLRERIQRLEKAAASTP